MSSCADSCYTCYRAVSFASGTSVSLPLAAAPGSFPSVRSYFPPRHPRLFVLHRSSQTNTTGARSNFGSALCAAALWSWSSGLHPPRSGSGLHPRTSLPEMLNALHRPSTTLAQSICHSCVSVKTTMPHSGFSTAFMAGPAQISASPSPTQALRICCPPQKDQTIVADCEHQTRHGTFKTHSSLLPSPDRLPSFRRIESTTAKAASKHNRRIR